MDPTKIIPSSLFGTLSDELRKGWAFGDPAKKNAVDACPFPTIFNVMLITILLIIAWFIHANYHFNPQILPRAGYIYAMRTVLL